MKKIMLLCLVIITIGCSRKENYSATIDSTNNQINEVDKTNFPINENNIIAVLKPGEEKLQYFGTVLHSIINYDNVNVRIYPSLDAEILHQLNKNTEIIIIGTSKEIDNIDEHIGHWHEIMLKAQNPNFLWDTSIVGWVFSKYVEYRHISSSELKIIEMPTREGHRNQRLIASYQVNGINKIVSFSSHRVEHQNFYTFAYDWSTEEFHYSNIPGSYAWYPETNELKHISYIGTDMESKWSIFTDDYKYLIQDFGTAPDPRGLGVWRVDNSEKVFSGMYYEDINLQGNTINIIYQYNYWNISRDRLDVEIIDFAKEFIENNPVPKDMELIVVCELDLDTGIRSILRGQFVYTQ
jgi:hypothetical protein